MMVHVVRSHKRAAKVCANDDGNPKSVYQSVRKLACHATEGRQEEKLYKRSRMNRSGSENNCTGITDDTHVRSFSDLMEIWRPNRRGVQYDPAPLALPMLETQLLLLLVFDEDAANAAAAATLAADPIDSMGRIFLGRPMGTRGYENEWDMSINIQGVKFY